MKRNKINKANNSMYRTVLVRSIKTKMDVEKELPRVLQHFVFLLNKYYRLNFKEDAIPSEIIAFRDEIELLIGTQAKVFKFQCSAETPSEVVCELMGTHMFLTRKAPDDFQSILSEFDKLIPWNPPSPDLSHPTTPESSLSTLTDDSDEIEVIPDG